jgi:hypothetical protein
VADNLKHKAGLANPSVTLDVKECDSLVICGNVTSSS